MLLTFFKTTLDYGSYVSPISRNLSSIFDVSYLKQAYLFFSKYLSMELLFLIDAIDSSLFNRTPL